MDGLRREWILRKGQIKDWDIVSIYFGGGTPSLLHPKYFEEILSWMPTAQPEITLELNPETATLQKLKQFKSLGINRLSIGVQSLHIPTLQLLGRTHDAEKAIETIHYARDAGFDNITIDLMYDIPDQDEESWNATIQKACELPINHLSLYNLTIEPHTAFYKHRERLEKMRPSEDSSTRMLHQAIKTFEEAGLKRYEISAFSRPGKESLHNIGYWQGREFMGYGPSAFSFVDGARFSNVAHLKKYCDALARGEDPMDFHEKLPFPRNLRESIAVRLRVLEGFNVSATEEIWSDLRRLEEDSLLSINGDHVALTNRGADLYDLVASELV